MDKCNSCGKEEVVYNDLVVGNVCSECYNKLFEGLYPKKALAENFINLGLSYLDFRKVALLKKVLKGLRSHYGRVEFRNIMGYTSKSHIGSLNYIIYNDDKPIYNVCIRPNLFDKEFITVSYSGYDKNDCVGNVNKIVEIKCFIYGNQSIKWQDNYSELNFKIFHKHKVLNNVMS